MSKRGVYFRSSTAHILPTTSFCRLVRSARFSLGNRSHGLPWAMQRHVTTIKLVGVPRVAATAAEQDITCALDGRGGQGFSIPES